MTALEKLSPEARMDLCRKYFLIGFAGLPLVWLVNVVWFSWFLRSSATQQDLTPQEKSIRKYVIGSALGVLVWAMAIGAWVYAYQSSRVVRAEWAEALTFLFPLGRV